MDISVLTKLDFKILQILTLTKDKVFDKRLNT